MGKRKEKSSVIRVGDFVFCKKCEFEGLIITNSNKCPICGGTDLDWVMDEPFHNVHMNLVGKKLLDEFWDIKTHDGVLSERFYHFDAGTPVEEVTSYLRENYELDI